MVISMKTRAFLSEIGIPSLFLSVLVTIGAFATFQLPYLQEFDHLEKQIAQNFFASGHCDVAQSWDQSISCVQKTGE